MHIYIMYVIYYYLFIYSKSGSTYTLRNGYFNVWEMVQSKKSLCANVRSGIPTPTTMEVGWGGGNHDGQVDVCMLVLGRDTRGSWEFSGHGD